jgi:hypothetical protein
MLGFNLWPLYLIAAISAPLGLALVLLPVRGTLRWLRRHSSDPDKRPSRPRLTTSGAEILGGITLCAVSVAAASLILAVASYGAVSEKTLCAVIRAEPHPVRPQRMWFEYSPVVDGSVRPKKVYILEGDQWGVEGHVLRWSEWARVLGLRTCYRMTRISSRYRTVAAARTHKATLIDLGGEDNWLWQLLQDNDHKLPGVEATWTSGAWKGPVKNQVFEVWVSPGGYSIKRRK